jgi:hypothetical protein
MEAIWKEILEVDDKQTVELPIRSKVLCVREQHGHPCIWFKTPRTDSPPTELRTFSTYGTGHEHNNITGEYIGTYQMMNGKLVYHVFEEK